MFELLATYRNRGGVLAAAVGPGPTPGSERLYQSYIYVAGSLELVAIDPESGSAAVFPSPVPSEYGAWGLALGPDDNVYLGTLPHAHIFRFAPRSGTFSDRGRPSESEQYIWQLALGSDGRLYGCTYPSAKLVRFDPRSGQGEDLGRLDPTEQYARHIAAGADGFVYVGIGTSRAQLVAYAIASGQRRGLLPDTERPVGTGIVRRGSDGFVYGQVGAQHFRLHGGDAFPLTPAPLPAAEATNRLRDGRLVETDGNQLRLRDPLTGQEVVRPFDYAGSALQVFRLGWGPDDRLYGSSVLAAHLFRLAPGDGAVEQLARVGGGECYAFLRSGGRLLAAIYGGTAPLLRYDPTQPLAPGEGPAANPRFIHYDGENGGWRPMAMIAGLDGKVYLGAVAGYGELGGPLTIWDPATDQVTSFPHLVPDQSVVTLAAAGDLIVGGTTVAGGGGSRPTQTEAKLFLWDWQQQQKVFEGVPVPGAREITDLVVLPGDQVAGIAGVDTLFVFDLPKRAVHHTAPLPFQGVIYNSAALGPDGGIWGLAKAGIFRIDALTWQVALVAEAPEPITSGIALDGRDLYFGAGARIYRYRLSGI